MPYNPNQPRDPEGTSTGGQWTRIGSASRAGRAARKAAGLPDELISGMLQQMRENHGFSVSLAGKSPERGYMVALAKDSETRIPMEDFDERAAVEFILEHQGELQAPDMYIGGWETSDDSGKAFACLDTSKNILDFDAAMLAGAKGKQDAIWDVVNQKEYYPVDKYPEYYEKEKAK